MYYSNPFRPLSGDDPETDSGSGSSILGKVSATDAEARQRAVDRLPFVDYDEGDADDGSDDAATALLATVKGSIVTGALAPKQSKQQHFAGRGEVAPGQRSPSAFGLEAQDDMLWFHPRPVRPEDEDEDFSKELYEKYESEIGTIRADMYKRYQTYEVERQVIGAMLYKIICKLEGDRLGASASATFETKEVAGKRRETLVNFGVKLGEDTERADAERELTTRHAQLGSIFFIENGKDIHQWDNDYMDQLTRLVDQETGNGLENFECFGAPNIFQQAVSIACSPAYGDRQRMLVSTPTGTGKTNMAIRVLEAHRLSGRAMIVVVRDGKQEEQFWEEMGKLDNEFKKIAMNSTGAEGKMSGQAMKEYWLKLPKKDGSSMFDAHKKKEHPIRAFSYRDLQDLLDLSGNQLNTGNKKSNPLGAFLKYPGNVLNNAYYSAKSTEPRVFDPAAPHFKISHWLQSKVLVFDECEILMEPAFEKLRTHVLSHSQGSAVYFFTATFMKESYDEINRFLRVVKSQPYAYSLERERGLAVQYAKAPLRNFLITWDSVMLPNFPPVKIMLHNNDTFSPDPGPNRPGEVSIDEGTRVDPMQVLSVTQVLVSDSLLSDYYRQAWQNTKCVTDFPNEKPKLNTKNLSSNSRALRELDGFMAKRPVFKDVADMVSQLKDKLLSVLEDRFQVTGQWPNLNSSSSNVSDIETYLGELHQPEESWAGSGGIMIKSDDSGLTLTLDDDYFQSKIVNRYVDVSVPAACAAISNATLTTSKALFVASYMRTCPDDDKVLLLCDSADVAIYHGILSKRTKLFTAYFGPKTPGKKTTSTTTLVVKDKDGKATNYIRDPKKEKEDWQKFAGKCICVSDREEGINFNGANTLFLPPHPVWKTTIQRMGRVLRYCMNDDDEVRISFLVGIHPFVQTLDEIKFIAMLKSRWTYVDAMLKWTTSEMYNLFRKNVEDAMGFSVAIRRSPLISYSIQSARSVSSGRSREYNTIVTARPHLTMDAYLQDSKNRRQFDNAMSMMTTYYRGIDYAENQKMFKHWLKIQHKRAKVDVGRADATLMTLSRMQTSNVAERASVLNNL